MIGLKTKKILGTEFAGEIVKIGTGVIKFAIGEEVYGSTTKERSGGLTEYLCVNESGIIAQKPKNMSFKEAATVPIGAMTALYLLRKKNIENHRRVMVYGASGSVGTFAIQISMYFGATVTGVCSSPNKGMVSSLGADQVIDYTSDEFIDHTEKYDLVFDAVGKLS